VAAKTPSTPEPPAGSLDKIGERFASIHDELLAALDLARKSAEAEVAAGRLNETNAQSLRLTLRSATSIMVGADIRNVISAARVPSDKQAVSDAFQQAGSDLGRLACPQGGVAKGGGAEGTRRSSEVVEKGKLPAEADTPGSSDLSGCLHQIAVGSSVLSCYRVPA
jgi:hypothetical protein